MRELNKVSFTPRLLRFEQAVGSSVAVVSCTWGCVAHGFAWLTVLGRPIVSDMGQGVL